MKQETEEKLNKFCKKVTLFCLVFLSVTSLLILWEKVHPDSFNDLFIRNVVMRSTFHLGCLDSSEIRGISDDVTEGCEDDYCKAEKIWTFVRSNVIYVKQPNDTLRSADFIYMEKEGDCDDFTSLGYCLLYYNGISRKVEFTKNHVYLSVYLDGKKCYFDPTRGTLSSGFRCSDIFPVEIYTNNQEDN